MTIEIIKLRSNGTHKIFYCDSQEYADDKIKSNPEMYMTKEDFRGKSEAPKRGRKSKEYISEE